MEVVNDLDRLATLQDPVRRRLYDYVREAQDPVGREQAADATGISRSLAAYHLDKLAEQGLLGTSYRRPEGRGGPGAGRPAKLYTPAEEELAVAVPARDYEFAARLMADAAEADSTGGAESALKRVARAQGRDAGRGRAELRAALRERGYEPVEDERGVIRLRNCPFHRLAQEHRDLVCGMNHSFLEGMLEGLEEEDMEGCLEPEPGRCCVVIRPRE
jgi:predicted ArsR family transcriptional regulator